MEFSSKVHLKKNDISVGKRTRYKGYVIIYLHFVLPIALTLQHKELLSPL